jgi:hypothetical protein
VVDIIGVNSKCCSRISTNVMCVTCGAKQFRMCDNVESVFLDFLNFILTQQPQWARTSSFMRFLDHTRRITVGRTPLDE